MIKHVKNKTIISLNPEEYYKLQEILIDEDKDKALTFIKNVLGKMNLKINLKKF